MGSICDMSNTNRAFLLLAQLGDKPGMMALVGETVEILAAGMSPELSAISTWVRVRYPDGRIEEYDLGDCYEIVDYGVAGYALEEIYTEDELRTAIEAVMASPDISPEDRAALKDDLEALPRLYH